MGRYVVVADGQKEGRQNVKNAVRRDAENSQKLERLNWSDR